MRVRFVAAALASLAVAACSGGGDPPFRPGSGSSGTTLVGTPPNATGTLATSFGASLTPSTSSRLYAVRSIPDISSASGTDYFLDVYAAPLGATSIPALSVPLVDDATGAPIVPTTALNSIALAIDREGDVAVAPYSNDSFGIDVFAQPLSTASLPMPIAGAATALPGKQQYDLAFDSQSRLLVLGGGTSTAVNGVAVGNQVVRYVPPLTKTSGPDLTLDVGAQIEFNFDLTAIAVGNANELIAVSNVVGTGGTTNQLFGFPSPYSIVPPISIPFTAVANGAMSMTSDANGSAYIVESMRGLEYLQGPLANLPVPTGAGNGPNAMATPEPATVTVPYTPAIGPSTIVLDPGGDVFAIGTTSAAAASNAQIVAFQRPLTTFSAPYLALPCTGTGCTFIAIAFGP